MYETSRTLHERTREHFRDANDFGEGSHMVKHWLTAHEDDETCPEFKFRIVANFKDCLSRQVTEAVMIHYSPDILLNSKNEYNANCLARVKVDESRYEQKNRERMEALEEAKEKEAWSTFKNRKAGFRKRKEKDDTPEVPKAKKPRIEQPQYPEVIDIGDWLGRMEKVCQRAGELRRYLGMDKLRMLRRMETLEEDQILNDIQPMWEEKLPCGWKEIEDEDPIPNGGKPSGAGYPVTTPHSRDPGEGGGDVDQQPGEEDGGTPIEVVGSTCRIVSLEEDPILTDIQPMWGEKLPCGWKEVEDEDPIPDGGKHSGAGYPVTTPHSRDPGEGGGDAELKPGGGDDQPQQDIHTQPTGRRKLARITGRKDIPSTWWESLVGLVGWWRRVELESTKLETKIRKLEEDRRKKEENKLEFLRKFYPNISTTPGGSEKLKSGKKTLNFLTHPSERYRQDEFSFSPHAKRKTGGGGHIGAHTLASPSKKLKFTKQLSFWREKSGIGYLVGPDSQVADNLGRTTDLAEQEYDL